MTVAPTPDQPEVAPTTILTDPSESVATNTLNYIVAGLSIAKFRGCVVFILLENDLMQYSAVITFTDDIPQGSWNLTRYD